MKKTLLALAAFGLLFAVPAQAAEGNAEHGQTLFTTTAQCKMCHKADVNSIGPSLSGVFGRKAGTATGFSYSAGMKAATWVWDAAMLDKWLAAPATLVPGTRMVTRVASEQDRADIIAYLKTLTAAAK